jgi:hypothetical protein
VNFAIANNNRSTEEAKESQLPTVELRVWWTSQVPGRPLWYRVPTIEAAQMLVGALAKYDDFQHRSRIKPEYPSAGGASWRHSALTDGRWFDFDPENDSDCEDLRDAITKLASQGLAAT